MPRPRVRAAHGFGVKQRGQKGYFGGQTSAPQSAVFRCMSADRFLELDELIHHEAFLNDGALHQLQQEPPMINGEALSGGGQMIHVPPFITFITAVRYVGASCPHSDRRCQAATFVACRCQSLPVVACR
jgi:hypothetical protein